MLTVKQIPIITETKGYIKNVWRNLFVYRHMNGIRGDQKIAPPGEAEPEPKIATPVFPQIPSQRPEPIREIP